MGTHAKKEPMTKQEADNILDTAIRRVMAEDKVDYSTAFYTVQRRKPGMVEGYSAVVKRSLKPNHRSL